MLFALGLWANFTKNGSLEWMITIFSLSTLPNTFVMGIPLLIAMYDEYSGMLMVQVVVLLQCIIWYTFLLFLFEYRGAKMLIMEQFPETAASIVSFKVDSDVVSLDGRVFLQTDAEIGEDEKLHVVVRKSNASRRSLGLVRFRYWHPGHPISPVLRYTSWARLEIPLPRARILTTPTFIPWWAFKDFPRGNLLSVQLFCTQFSHQGNQLQYLSILKKIVRPCLHDLDFI